MTQQALLTRLIDDAYESRDEGIDSFRESAVPLSEREKAAMREGRFGRRDRRGGHRRHPLRMTVLVDTGVPSFDDDFDGIAERTDPSTV